MKARWTLLLVAATVAVFAGTARGFSPPIHGSITDIGLDDPSNPPFGFLRPAVNEDILRQHAYMDDGFPTSSRGGQDQRHFDDCEFDGGAKFIRTSYRDARSSLARTDPFETTDAFGNALHTVQDFYAHSNWVEVGFPRGELATVADLVDLSGAPRGLDWRWNAPGLGGLVRGDILLGADDGVLLPGHFVDADGGGQHVPTLLYGLTPNTRTLGRLLVTGRGFADHECNIGVYLGTTPSGQAQIGQIFEGFRHDCSAPCIGLNKDTADGPNGPLLHGKARALATLQTSYEWCRLVREAAAAEPRAADGLLLATWVRPGANPHPPGTPCARAPRGPTAVVVTILSVRVRDSHDSNAHDPGEIQLAATLFDSPTRFHRSVHVTNRSARHMNLDDGETVPGGQLPPPMMLCVGQGRGATLALHAWDDDEDSGDRFEDDFDNLGDEDDVLRGFQTRIGSQVPTGVQQRSSPDLEVRYRVSRRVPGATHAPCPAPARAANGAR